MSGILVKVGALMALNNHLGDGVTGKYVRAILKDSEGNVLAASPVDMTDVGDGTYVDKSVPFPDVDAVLAAYKVYNDAGYTELSADHDDGIDIFIRDLFSPETRKDEIIGKIVSEQSITGIIIPGQISAKLSQDAIRGKIPTSQSLETEIRDDAIKGVVYR